MPPVLAAYSEPLAHVSGAAQVANAIPLVVMHLCSN